MVSIVLNRHCRLHSKGWVKTSNRLDSYSQCMDTEANIIQQLVELKSEEFHLSYLKHGISNNMIWFHIQSQLEYNVFHSESRKSHGNAINGFGKSDFWYPKVEGTTIITWFISWKLKIFPFKVLNSSSVKPKKIKIAQRMSPYHRKINWRRVNSVITNLPKVNSVLLVLVCFPYSLGSVFIFQSIMDYE